MSWRDRVYVQCDVCPKGSMNHFQIYFEGKELSYVCPECGTHYTLATFPTREETIPQERV